MLREKSTVVFVGPNATKDVGFWVTTHDRAVLIEPQPDICNRLRAMFRGHRHVTVVQAACGSEEGTKRLNVYHHDGWSSSLGTMTSQAIEGYSGIDLSLRDSYDVKVVRLDRELQRLGIERISSLVIDAQGMDLSILKTVEPMLRRADICVVRAEADKDGFTHYHGLPDNSYSAHLKFMEGCGYALAHNDEGICCHNPTWVHESVDDDMLDYHPLIEVHA